MRLPGVPTMIEQLGEDDVRYDFMSTYEELMDKVMQ